MPLNQSDLDNIASLFDAKLDAKFEENSKELAKLGKKFGELQSEFGEFKSEFGEFKSEFGELKRRLVDLESDFGRLNHTVKSIGLSPTRGSAFPRSPYVAVANIIRRDGSVERAVFHVATEYRSMTRGRRWKW
jgi:hypothetical protein